MGIRRGIVPRYPSLFSAWGILAADLRHAYTQTLNRSLDETSAQELNEIVAALRKQGEAQLAADGVTAEGMSFTVTMDMRYAGQEHNVNVPAPATFDANQMSAVANRFHAAHRQLYTFELPGEPVLVEIPQRLKDGSKVQLEGARGDRGKGRAGAEDSRERGARSEQGAGANR